MQEDEVASMPHILSFPENIGVMASDINKAINEMIKSPLMVPKPCVTIEQECF